MKRVYCLYRVSTKGQVDKDDIPMQRKACQEFVSRQADWCVVNEFYEKGISGFKVSANDRDAIQDLKNAAEKKEFDILLVFMFDRLGRRQDETPFVVEWFANQGIEVWSTQEGRQCFENDVDYLMNFIRFWQANGESKKTSTRVKTRMGQLIADGEYAGGVAPYGYKWVDSDRINKRGDNVQKLEIVPQEAEVIKQIYNLTIKDGKGAFQVADTLNKQGLRTHNNSKFQCNSITRILSNKIYCGYHVKGESVSPHKEEVQIIDSNLYERAQEILSLRKTKNGVKQKTAFATKGRALLSGNLYCSHCGSRMVATGSMDRYTRKDGSVYESKYTVYICYNKARGRGDCKGQSVYVASKVDGVIENIIKDYFNSIMQTPKDVAMEKRYKSKLKEMREEREYLESEKTKLRIKQEELTDEIASSLVGDSKFTPEVLSKAIERIKDKIQEAEIKIKNNQQNITNQETTVKSLDFYYQEFKSWADEYDLATQEKKRLIVNQLVKSVRISRGYIFEVELNVNYNQFTAKSA